MKCINCGAGVSSKFCPDCGQKNPPRKITVGHLYHDFQARIYGFDGMFPRTLRDITIRPGAASRTFITGNRVLYYGPVGYFFLMITLWLLLMSLFDVSVVEFMKETGKYAMYDDPKAGSGQEKFMESIFAFTSENLKLISFALIPIWAFCSRFFFFRKSDYNFLEHTVLPFYVQGHIYWISIFSVLYYKVTGMFFPSWLNIVVILGFFSFSYADFFNYQSKLKAFLKGLGVYMLAQIIFSLIAVIIVVIMILIDPDVYQMLKPSNNP